MVAQKIRHIFVHLITYFVKNLPIYKLFTLSESGEFS